jgi:hypothetical protein
LLGQKSMHIDEQDGQFVVTLPLLVNHEAVRIS